MLRIFKPVEIQRLRPGLNPQTWVPEASMLTTRPPKPSGLHCKEIFQFRCFVDVIFFRNQHFNEPMFMSTS